MVVHAFNLTLGRQRQADLLECEAILVYIASSRLVKATLGDPASENKEVKKGLGWRQHL